MIYITYFDSLMDISIFKKNYTIELFNDSLAKNINIGDIVFGNDDEEINYKVKYKSYNPIEDEMFFSVYKV
jgi:hypothetical protein